MKTRKTASKRDPFDYYPTPSWCVHRLLEAKVLPEKKDVWLEPSAGDGAIVRAVSSFSSVEGDRVLRYSPHWIVYEIQPRFQQDLESVATPSSVHIQSFLDLPSKSGAAAGITPSVILGNPPYSFALEFVKKAMELGPNYVCFLLRISFLGSSERSSFMRQNMPDVYLLPNRPSFNGKGADTSEYGWFVWKRNDQGTYESKTGIVQILNETPKENRNPKQKR